MYALLGLAALVVLPGCGGDQPPPKILVIGVDGGTFDLLAPWLEEGRLPVLAGLVEEGVSGTLYSVLPPLSPPAWTSAVTGVNPGAHGIFDFNRPDPESLQPILETASNRRVPALWTLLSEQGRRVGILNVPMSDPPDPVDGYLVAGFPHPDTVGYTYPPELEERLRNLGYRLDTMGNLLVPGREWDLRNEFFATFERRRDAALVLTREHPELDLNWIVFTGTDRAQHYYWKFMDRDHPFYDAGLAEIHGTVIRDMWEAVDAAIGELIAISEVQAAEQGRELAVIVLSDHGFGGIYRAFRPQSLLKQPPDGRPPIEHAYCVDTNASLIFVPRPGRETHAPYGRDEHPEVVAEIRDRILAARDPETGLCPALGGWTREEAFTGRYVDRGPDLVFLPRPNTYFIHEAGDKDPFGRVDFTFNAFHEIDGLIIARGPMFTKGEIEGNQNLLDVMPTVMHLAGAVVPGYVEGKVLTSLFSPSFRKARPVVVDSRSAREVGGDGEVIRGIPYLN
jgi:predicted AlkP superfamily phosphohydrolase/phosphomutase